MRPARARRGLHPQRTTRAPTGSPGRARLILPPLLALLGALTLLALTIAHNPAAPPSEHLSGPLMPPGMRAPAFSLTDQDGRPATLSQYAARVTVIGFMYSRCQTACPLMATEIRGALNELPGDGRNVPVLAISVDPTHDTPASAREFIAREQMTGRMRFLLGTGRQLGPIWKRYGVQPLAHGSEHTAFVFVMDRHGLLRVGYPADQLVPEALAHDLGLLLANHPVATAAIGTANR